MSEDRTHMHHHHLQQQHPTANKGLVVRLRENQERDNTKKAEAVLASFVKSKLAQQHRQRRSGHDGGNNTSDSPAGKDLAVLHPKQQPGDILPRETPAPPPYYARHQKKKRDEKVVEVRRTTQRKTGATQGVVNKGESWRESPPPPYRDAISPDFETGHERARYAERGAATLNRPRPSFDTAASITTIDSFDTFAAWAPASTPQTRPPQRCPTVAKSSSRKPRGESNNGNNGSGHIQNDPAVVVHARQPMITTATVGQGAWAAPGPPAPVVRSHPVHAESSPTSEPSPTPGWLTPPSSHLELLRSRILGTSPVAVDSHSKQLSTLSGPGGGGRARSNPWGEREELDESCSLASILPGGNRFEHQDRFEPTSRRSDAAREAKHFLGTPPPGPRTHPGRDLETSRQDQDPTPPKSGRRRAGEGERGDKSDGGGGGSGDGGTPQPLTIRVASTSYRSSPHKEQQGRRGKDNFPFSPMVVHPSPPSAFATCRNSYHTATVRRTGGGGGATAEMRVRICENSEKEKAAKTPPRAAAAGAAGAAAVEPAVAVEMPPVVMAPGGEPGSSPSASPPVWVTRHIDCSDTCGLVLVMSDSSVGLLFNDGTKMMFGPVGDTLEYTEPSSPPTHKPELGAEGRARGGSDAAATATAALGHPRRSACGGATSYNYTLDSFPFYLRRKVAAVRYFREHLLPEGGRFADGTGEETGCKSPAVAEAAEAVVGQGRQAPLAFIEKWQREGDS
ncbi:unnamed protein product, partial [Ectocarpus sp. 12 AP-2014]